MREQIDRLYRAINDGNLDTLDELFAPDYVDHTEGYRGVEALKAQLGAFRAAFPDLHVTVDDLIEAGDQIATRTTFTGTHTGELMGLPPTGKTTSVGAVDIARFHAGQADERWGGLDMYALLKQLGALPEPQPPDQHKPDPTHRASRRQRHGPRWSKAPAPDAHISPSWPPAAALLITRHRPLGNRRDQPAGSTD